MMKTHVSVQLDESGHGSVKINGQEVCCTHIEIIAGVDKATQVRVTLMASVEADSATVMPYVCKPGAYRA